MRKLFLFLIIPLLLSCKKDEIEYNDIHVDVEDSIDGTGITLEGSWVLIGGQMYVTNLDNNVKTRYAHFSDEKTHSSMRMDGSIYRIEELYVDSTTWTFRKYSDSPYGKFYLDKDSVNYYGMQISTYANRITEAMEVNLPRKMAGSAKPFRAFVNDLEYQIIDIKVHEAYTNDGVNNFNYYSILQFKKLDD